MSNVSYEVISLKGGRWITESNGDDKAYALQQAEEIMASGFFMAVKVLEETYDDETGTSKTSLIFNKKKQLGREASLYTGPERRQSNEWRDDPKGFAKRAKKKAKQRRKNSFLDDIIRLVLVVGALLLGGIAVAIWYVTTFG